MRPTKLVLLLALALVGGVLGFAIAQIFNTWAALTLPVPWSSAITVAACAAALAGWSWNFRNRLQDKDVVIAPAQAVRTAALAMAASRAGAIIAGLYLGITAWLSLDLSKPAAQDRLWVCVVGAVVALALAAVGLWLEHMCRLPEDDDPDEVADPNADWQLP